MFAFKQKLGKANDRQIRQLDYIGQISTDIGFISGKENIPADLMSRVHSFGAEIDYGDLAPDHKLDEELNRILRGEESVSLKLRFFQVSLMTQRFVWPGI